MKEKIAKLGWTGWAVVGLVVVLIVGAIVAANTQTPVAEGGDEPDEVAIDASNDEVVNVAEESVEEAPVVAGDNVVVIGEAESLPQSGAIGQNEFVY